MTEVLNLGVLWSERVMPFKPGDPEIGRMRGQAAAPLFRVIKAEHQYPVDDTFEYPLPGCGLCRVDGRHAGLTQACAGRAFGQFFVKATLVELGDGLTL